MATYFDNTYGSEIYNKKQAKIKINILYKTRCFTYTVLAWFNILLLLFLSVAA